MNIWEVVYNDVFESSSGMEKYSSSHENIKVLVWTHGKSLDNVKEAINKGIGNQTRVTKLVQVTWLGETINNYYESDSQ